MKLYKGTVGRNAYIVSYVWTLGLHVFNSPGEKIIRLCYFRRKRTHYIQLSWEVKANLQSDKEII